MEAPYIAIFPAPEAERKWDYLNQQHLLMHRTPQLFIILLLMLGLLGIAQATVYYSKEEAFELAFGSGADIQNTPVFLTDEQVAEVEKTAKVKLDTKLFTFYTGSKQGETLGHAAIESHTVRTQPETLLIVLSPKGELIRVETLAFHEPPEYQPPARWFATLYRRAAHELQLNQGADGISGATLSCRASLDSIRKVMAIFRIALSEGVH